MFWILVSSIFFGVLLIKLGAYSAWVSLISTGLKFATLLVTGLIIYKVWKKLTKQKS